MPSENASSSASEHGTHLVLIQSHQHLTDHSQYGSTLRVFAGGMLLSGALRLSQPRTTTCLSISSRLQTHLPCHRGFHQLRPSRQTTTSGKSLSTRAPILSLSRTWARQYTLAGFSDRGPTTTTTLPRSALEPRFFSSNGALLLLAPSAQQQNQQLPVLSPPAVRNWLLLSSVLVLAVIVVGGVTRLTESGLSITEWRPITGVLPPLSRAEWEDEFDKYKATPEFRLCVFGFSPPKSFSA